MVALSQKSSKLWDELLAAKLIRLDELAICKSFLEDNPRARVRDLLEFLQEEQILTEYQANHIQDGKTRELVCSSYTVADIVGKGSFGNVYRVRKHETGQFYAMKVLAERNPELIARYAKRLQDFSQFRSRAIIPLVHLFCQRGRMSLVWPFVDQGQYGTTLAKLVQSEERLTPKDTALVAIQLTNALKTVHDQELFHGLLKPSNVLVTSKRAVRLLDFGIGFLLSVGRKESLIDTVTHANQIASNLDCSSPETINDSSVRNPASDRYSLGCILYYCLTGQFPFPDPNPVKKMLGHSCEEPTPIQELCPEVPKVLATIVHKLLRKNPEERFSSTGELLAALESMRSRTSASKSEGNARRRFVSSAPRPQPVPTRKSAPPMPAPEPVAEITPAAPEAKTKPKAKRDKKDTSILEKSAYWAGLVAMGAAAGFGAYLWF